MAVNGALPNIQEKYTESQIIIFEAILSSTFNMPLMLCDLSAADITKFQEYQADMLAIKSHRAQKAASFEKQRENFEGAEGDALLTPNVYAPGQGARRKEFKDQKPGFTPRAPYSRSAHKSKPQ